VASRVGTAAYSWDPFTNIATNPPNWGERANVVDVDNVNMEANSSHATNLDADLLIRCERHVRAVAPLPGVAAFLVDDEPVARVVTVPDDMAIAFGDLYVAHVAERGQPGEPVLDVCIRKLTVSAARETAHAALQGFRTAAAKPRTGARLDVLERVSLARGTV
jgi:hypothetical protein